MSDPNARLDTVPDHIPPECVVDWDFNNIPGGRDDIHLAWKKLQEGPDIQWTPYYGGHWILTRAEHIREVQKDYEHFSHKIMALPRAIHPSTAPLDLDPPEHTPIRRIINIAFSPAVIHSLRPRLRQMCIDLIEGIRPGGECEFTSAFAQKFPTTLVIELLDLPVNRLPDFVRWADLIVHGDRDAKMEGYTHVMEYLKTVVTQRFETPGDDLISQIINSKVDDKPLTFEVALAMTTNLFLGGLDTVASMLSFCTRFLAEHPEHRKQLIDDPEKIPNAVEELLRRHGLSNTVRLITRDYDFHGYPLKKDELIMVPISLSGLDDRKWGNAVEVDFDRDTRDMDTFGNGPHRCPGSFLARVELAIFLEEWLKRIPDFSIKKGTKPVTTPGLVPGVVSLQLEWPVN